MEFFEAALIKWINYFPLLLGEERVCYRGAIWDNGNLPDQRNNHERLKTVRGFGAYEYFRAFKSSGQFMYATFAVVRAGSILRYDAGL